MAIGYTVVMGWIFGYMIGTFTGKTLSAVSVEDFAGAFESMASAFDNFWQIVALVVAMVILAFGVGKGIEKVNKVLMPVFFLLFVALGIYVAFPARCSGWIPLYFPVWNQKHLQIRRPGFFALGQAFFSLSVAGNGTLIYGSYLSDGENIPAAAGRVAFLIRSLLCLLRWLLSRRWQLREHS